MKNKQKFTLGFIFNKELNKVLLIKKNRGPKNLDKMKGLLNGLGGHCEENEEPLDCIIREVREEAGLNIMDWHYYCLLDAKFGYVYCFYTVTDDIYNYQQMEDEKIKIYDLEKTYSSIHGIFNNEKWYKHFNRMPNLDWLIPMALNHFQKLDETDVFMVKETYKEV